ncbi:MAG: acyl-CoA thioesterase [Caulobacteraceae bacterium]|nr:acyl-CoA thioesterase [Caulobacter sp.]
MRPDPERLRLATYPYATELDTRFGDMDVQGHLNNVALAGLYEEARVRFVSSLARIHSRPDGQRPMLAQATLRYLAEGRYPGRVAAASGVLRIGRTSYVIGQALFQGDVCIGTADIVIVWTASGRPASIPQELRAALERALIDLPAEAGA